MSSGRVGVAVAVDHPARPRVARPARHDDVGAAAVVQALFAAAERDVRDARVVEGQRDAGEHDRGHVGDLLDRERAAAGGLGVHDLPVGDGWVAHQPHTHRRLEAAAQEDQTQPPVGRDAELRHVAGVALLDRRRREHPARRRHDDRGVGAAGGATVGPRGPRRLGAAAARERHERRGREQGPPRGRARRAERAEAGHHWQVVHRLFSVRHDAGQPGVAAARSVHV
jgi:hypothetical protein